MRRYLQHATARSISGAWRCQPPVPRPLSSIANKRSGLDVGGHAQGANARPYLRHRNAPATTLWLVVPSGFSTFYRYRPHAHGTVRGGHGTRRDVAFTAPRHSVAHLAGTARPTHFRTRTARDACTTFACWPGAFSHWGAPPQLLVLLTLRDHSYTVRCGAQHSLNI